MRNVAQNALILSFLTGMFVLGVNTSSCGEGIINVHGYSHAVAMCDGGPDTSVTTQKGEYSMWSEGGITYTVNYGHMEDPEIDLLKRMAKVECEMLKDKS